MAYGALVIPRTRYASKVLSIDDSEAKKIPGFIKAVKIDDAMGKCTGWVVALAEKFPAAMKAAKALKVKSDPGPYGKLSLGRHPGGILGDYRRTTKASARLGAGRRCRQGSREADKVLEVEYTTDMVCHATMEPLNATVQFANGEWHVHVGTQSTSFARMTLTGYLSKVLNKKPEELKIFVHQYLVGGGFGGKQDYDDILAAAYCVKEIGRPVKLIQTRESQFRHQLRAHADLSQSQSRHQERRARRDEPGHRLRLDGRALRCRQEVRHRLAAARFLGREEAGHRPMVDRRQRSLVQREEPPRARLESAIATTWAVQASALRTVSNSYNMFVVESFMDEVAHAAGRDPLEFRLSMLNGKGGNRGIPNSGYAPGTQVRLLHGSIVDLAAVDQGRLLVPTSPAPSAARCDWRTACGWRPARSGYGTKRLPPNTGIGIAVSSAEERQSPTWVAGIAEVTVDPKTGQLHASTGSPSPWTRALRSIRRNIEAQIRGSALWGASQIMSERLTLKNGAFEQTNFHEYTPIRLAQVPEIDVDDHRVRPPSRRRRRAGLHRRGAGGGQRHLQRCRRACAAHADHGRSGAEGNEEGVRRRPGSAVPRRGAV